MTRADAVNAAAAAVAVALSVAAATLGEDPAPPAAVRVADTDAAGDVRVVPLDDGGGGRGVVDASGAVIPIAPYRRVASASSVSDWILAQLCGAECAVAYTERTAKQAPWRHTLVDASGGSGAKVATIASIDDIESVLALRPDLVVIDSFGDPRRVARLRERGLHVFDLGQMRGAASAARALRAVGAVLDRGERADRLARRYLRELEGIAAGGAGAARPQGAYVSAYGRQLFGGAGGTAYHDILTYAGIDDVAARRFEGFPEYTAEQLLVMDPDLIVTRDGGAEALCGHVGLGTLRACREPGRIVELEPFALDDPGQGILESAESLHEALH